MDLDVWLKSMHHVYKSQYFSKLITVKLADENQFFFHKILISYILN